MASGNENSQAVVEAEMRVCKAQDVREDTMSIMKPYANWEEYLVPAPLSIAILGQLICISAGEGDFSVNKNPPPNGFRYIRYPESFRACLCQVSHEGWHAFNEAHVNMDQIRLLTASIPGRMKLIVQTLFQEVDVVHAMLPRQLEDMKSIAEKCTTLARSVNYSYTGVINLIQEVLEACRNSKTGYERELEEVQIVLKQAKIREETATKNMKLAEEYYSRVKKQTEDSFDQYREAMNNVPSGWEAIGMMFVENFGNAVTGIANGISNLLQGKCGRSTKSDPFCRSGTLNIQSPLSAMTICGLSPMILSYASGLKEMVVTPDGINFENVYDRRTGEVKTNWAKDGFLKLHDNISREEPCQPKEKALFICMSGIHICEQLEDMVRYPRTGREEERAIINSIEKLYQQAAAFDTSSKDILRAPSFTPKQPNVANYQKASIGESVGVRNAHLKVEQSREMYKAMQEEYQRSFEYFKKQNEDLAGILCEMETCKVKEIDFETALKRLTEGLKAMGKVKEQWGKMLCFFEMISTIIDTCLSPRISGALGCASDVQKIKGYSSKSFVRDTIYSHAFTASSVAHLVHMIAETYTELSCKHLMAQINSLGRLQALECTDPEFNSERKAFKKRCDAARQAISIMVKKKKEEFESKLAARMQVIETELKAVLPPISRAEKKMIEAAVHDGRKELTTWEEDQYV